MPVHIGPASPTGTLYLEQAAVVRLDWPARSPDLNPIEYAWDMLQKAILLARFNQQLSGSSERLSLRIGPSILSISSVDLSVACDGDVRPLSMPTGTKHAIN